MNQKIIVLVIMDITKIIMEGIVFYVSILVLIVFRGLSVFHVRVKSGEIVLILVNV